MTHHLLLVPVAKAGPSTYAQPPAARPDLRRGPAMRIVVRASLVALFLALVPTVTWAKTFDCTDGDVACLIAAINHANATARARTTINLGPGIYTLTAVNNVTEGENGLPVIDSRVTIRGTDAGNTIIERSSSAPAFRIIYVSGQGSLNVRGVTVRGGMLPTFSGHNGGGILSHGPLTITESIITENALDFSSGGGIASEDRLTIEDSIIFRNSGGPDGSCGGVRATGPVTIVNRSTISQNGAENRAGGLCIVGPALIANSAIIGNGAGTTGTGGIAGGGGLIVINTTIANNSPNGIAAGDDVRILSSTIVGNAELGIQAGTGVTLRNTIVALHDSEDCVGPVTSLGNNLIGDPTRCVVTLQGTDLTGDPGLGTFTDDGTPGNGHFPLLATSQVIDAGNDAACPRRDQLGEKRRRPCDIGAIEFFHKARQP